MELKHRKARATRPAASSASVAIRRVFLLLAVVATAARGASAAGDESELAPARLRLSATQRPRWLAGAGEATATTTLGDGDTLLLAESFEDSWPVPPWSVTHPQAAVAVDWGVSDTRASDGTRSLWCAAGGPDAPPPGEGVPENSASWVIAGPFDLSKATRGRLAFDYWLRTEKYADTLTWAASTDGETFVGSATSTDTQGWRRMVIDLGSWTDLNLLGAREVWIAWVSTTDHSNRFEGAYLDNVSLAAGTDSGGEAVFRFTTTADFERGVRVGTAAVDDSLRLAPGPDTLPDLWVPNLGSGTVSRVDADSGAEIARYRTGPSDRDLEPMAVAVDLDGACWLANRAAGSVVKIGRAESGGCVDRDGNGTIDTSRDVNGDGNITDRELLAWGADECVLVEAALIPGREATGEPGRVHDSYDDTGVGALAVAADNDLWVGVPASRRFYKLDGRTGGIVDVIDLSDLGAEPFAAAVTADGILWATCWPDARVLRIDPVSGEVREVLMSQGTRGLAQDDERHLFVTGFEDGTLSRIDSSTARVEWTVSADWQADGVAVTGGGDVWIAAPGSGRLSRYSRDGLFLGSVPIGNLPTGIAIDHAGKLWITGADNDIIVRVDPHTGSADLQKDLVASGTHPSAGDLTGIVARSLTTRYGTWTAVCDGRSVQPAWDHVSWMATTSDNATVLVRVRTSADLEEWSSWESAVNGASFEMTPPGRYLEIEVVLQDLGSDSSPVLDEITAALAPSVEPPVASFTWSPPAPAAGETVEFVDLSSGSPSRWTWSFGDGTTSTEQNPSHAFQRPGNYGMSLVVDNPAGSSTAAHDIAVGDASPQDCAHSWWVPVVVHATGAQESRWRSDVALLALGPDAATIELRLHTSTGVRSREVEVAPGALVDIVDVVDWITRGGSGSGALELCADADLAVSSRTYSARSAEEPCLAEGTLGQHFAAVAAGSGLRAGDSAVLLHLRENDRFRTNLGLLNLSDETAEAMIVLFDSGGGEVARYPVTLAAGRWWQDLRPFRARAGLRHLGAGWARVEVVSGSGVVGYASLIDNITNDPTTIPMQPLEPSH